MKISRIAAVVLLLSLVAAWLPGRVSAAETTPMYRLYNPNSGEHFYTGSVDERDNLVAVGWNYEGIAWHAPISGGSPVYRVFNPNSGDHHYTMSQDEVDMLVGLGWQYEGVCWNSPSEGSAQYRLWNPNADLGSHHYTNSVEERDTLVSLGWILEGIGWYGVVDSHTHTYTAKVTPPFCENKGYTTYTCPCGHTYTDHETEPLGHDFGPWYISIRPTHETEGVEWRRCRRYYYDDEFGTIGCGAYEERTVAKVPPDACEQCEYEWVCDPSWEFDTGTCKNCGATKVIYASSSETSQAVLNEINAYRTAAGLSELQPDNRYATRITMRATELTISFSHVRPDGSQSGKAECIEAGAGNAKTAVSDWYNSSSHYGTIMDPNATRAIAAYNGTAWVVWIMQ